jgi:superfamily II DNA or RNA helicase
LDEAHHLTNKDTDDISSRAFVQILNVESTKQLALTATPKYLESEETNTVSNNNEAQFGQIIHQICLLWAIEHDIVCDYVIQTVIVDSNKIDDVENKRLFLAAYCALKSVANGNSHHMLIYCNDTINSELIIKYLRMLLSNIFSGLAETMFCSEYNSKMNTDVQMDILQQFYKSRFGIIVCVYCLGEGWNCPLLDAVVFAENMSSNIRILQCALRACRKNGSEKTCAKIILPVVDIDTDDGTNQDLKMVREVTRQMGLEDVTVISKLKVFREKEREKEENIRSGRKDDDDSFVCDEEITTRLRLKTTPRTTISFESLRKILAGKNIRSIEEYFQLCERDVRFPRNPEKTFQSLNMRWSWVYYLSIPSTFYDLETCKSKCREYLTTYPEIRMKILDISVVCEELCKFDIMFPPKGLWVDYYNVNQLSDIIQICKPLAKKKAIFS